MSIKGRIQNFRHIAYRYKAKLLHNTTFGKTMRSVAWNEATEADGLKVIYNREHDVFSEHTMNHISDEKAVKRFTWEVNRWSRQTDKIYLAEGTIRIEPKNSLAFLPGRKFIVPTRSTAHEYLRPPFFKALRRSILDKEYTYYKELIHFDGFVGRNLYHFFDESINAYLLLKESGLVDKSVPMLINEKIYRLKYVQYILGLPEFSDIQWIVQREGEWIKTDRLYKAVACYNYWQNTYTMMAEHVKKSPHRRIFLNRTPYFQRRLTNNDAIESILKEYGFETVYAEDLTYEQQVQLFAETKYLVAIHGAGVTNLIYSDMKEVRVMEIFSESLMHPHFYWFLELLRVNYYDAIIGSSFDINWNFQIDEQQFRKQLQTMMEGA